jgi:predicted dehydrogenase
MNIGILGAGRIAAQMADTINCMEGMKAYAIASRQLEKAVRFAKENHVEKAYGTYEEMLKDKEVDLVYIATPHALHFAHGKLCVEQHKPFLCEKPFAVNVAQAEELMNYAKKNGIFCTEALWTRYMPSCKMLKEIIRSGEIGEVLYLTANLGYALPQKGRLVQPELAGGALLDMGVYTLHFAASVLEGEWKEMTSVCKRSETGVDIQDAIITVSEDGKMAILHTTMLGDTEQQGIIYGTKGYIIAHHINNIQELEIVYHGKKERARISMPEQISGYEYELLACKRALEEKQIECKELPHQETVRVIRWMDRLREEWGVRYPFEMQETNHGRSSYDHAVSIC